jgi:elongation factor P
MVITVNDFKRGLRILLDGEPYVILDVHAQSPSARGAATITKLKVRNLRTSAVFEKSFRGSEKLEQPDLEFRPVQFLYRDDEGFHFMDTGSYEQVCLKEDEVGEGAGFLKEGLEDIRSVVFNGKVISVDLPNTVVLRVEETTPFIKGGTAQAQTKPALLETGMTIQVPAYMESGEDIVVDTREARFVSRAKG